jgi:hypothetical protein
MLQFRTLPIHFYNNLNHKIRRKKGAPTEPGTTKPGTTMPGTTKPRTTEPGMIFPESDQGWKAIPSNHYHESCRPNLADFIRNSREQNWQFEHEKICFVNKFS